jgi:hypothetical protein
MRPFSFLKWMAQAMAVWLLRCSVFREIPMAFFCDHFKKLNGCRH